MSMVYISGPGVMIGFLLSGIILSITLIVGIYQTQQAIDNSDVKKIKDKFNLVKLVGYLLSGAIIFFIGLLLFVWWAKKSAASRKK